MQAVSVVGLDLAKNVFQVHALESEGQVVVRRSLRRGAVLKFFGELPACLVGMEACASAHCWARELSAMGHTVRLMPPHYVNLTSSAARPTPRMPRRLRKRSRDRACALSVSRPWSSRVS